MTTPVAPHPALALAPEVAEALAAGRPVVALESTIISHGMPYPRNVEMAREVEQIVRDGGATPVDARTSGLMPDFVPPALTGVMARVERLFERTPVLDRLCAHNVILARKDT